MPHEHAINLNTNNPGIIAVNFQNNNKYKMKESFSNFNLKNELLKAINELGFKHPTPIQSKVIPHILFSKQDLIASAQTGTGKTAAFGLPLLELTHTDKIQTLILCPTRELCLHIAKDLTNYSKYLKNILPSKRKIFMLILTGVSTSR